MALATIPGYPRIGKHRELKKALEAFWSGKIGEEELQQTAAEVRRAGWETQAMAGIDLIPVNDFSFYDQVLDIAALVGAVPERYGWGDAGVDLDTYFAMARGRTGEHDVRAMEMTKWFDTNYHYIVPELHPDMTFTRSTDKPVAEFNEARGAGCNAKPVLVGPLTFVLLGKTHNEDVDPLALLDRLVPVYAEVIAELAAVGAEWIQIDEPVLVQDRSAEELAALTSAYEKLAAAKGSAKLIVQTYFDHVGEAYDTLVNLPVDAIGLDFVRGPENLDFIAEKGFPADKWLVAGVVDGRNVWVADLNKALGTLKRLTEYVDTERMMVSTSCSLLHVPYDVGEERELDAEVTSWLAFAEQKLHEVV
nr:5-methyltetrahydropteroyltriglutamate--homocysteine S-methyltransferase [Chloroflexia bacterium]